MPFKTIMQGLVITILTTLLPPLSVPAQKVTENLVEDLEVRFHETANKIGLIKSGMGDEIKVEPDELSVGYGLVIPLLRVSSGPLVLTPRQKVPCHYFTEYRKW